MMIQQRSPFIPISQSKLGPQFSGKDVTTAEAPPPEPTLAPTAKKPKSRLRKFITRTILASTLIGAGALGYRIHQAIPVIRTTSMNAVVSSPDYQTKTAAEKQELLWNEISRTPYTQLPATNSQGVTSGSGLGKLDNLCKLFDSGYMKNSFDQASDVRPSHNKLFHPFGATAKVSFVPKAGHPYTGIFQEGGIGLARLSLAASDSNTEYSPGIALKVLIDGKPSVNIFSIPSLDPQTSKDFFLRTPTNRFPVGDSSVGKTVNSLLQSEAGVPAANEVRVDHYAAIRSNGESVKTPVGPYQIQFRPAAVHFDPNTTNDFRTELGKVATGSVIYEVWGRATAESEEYVHIGDVKTASPFVASEFGDKELNFQHPR